MLLSSEGIILGSTKYGESSIIGHVLSKENGLLSVIASRSKKKRNVISNYFSPLSHVQFVCYYSQKAQIHRIKEISFAKINQLNSDDMAINALRFFLAEFLSKIIKEQEKNESLYLFLEGEIQKLGAPETNKNSFHISFLLKLLNHLGIQPQLLDSHKYFDIREGCSINNRPNHSEYFEKEILLLFLIGEKNSSKFSKLERVKLLNAILKYYSVQTDLDLENLKTKEVLEVVFN